MWFNSARQTSIQMPQEKEADYLLLHRASICAKTEIGGKKLSQGPEEQQEEDKGQGTGH